MRSTNYPVCMSPTAISDPAGSGTAQIGEGIPMNPEIVTSQLPNAIGVEHFEEVVGSLVHAAKKAGAKSVKINCYLCGEITF